MRNLEPEERETVVNTTDADTEVRIWTAQRVYITKLRRHPRVTELRSGFHGSTEWAEFTVPRDQWNPVTGVKRGHAGTDAQKRASLEALARARRTEP